MPVFSCAQCQTASDTKRLRCGKCHALLSRLTIGQVFQGRFLPIELLETDASVLTYAIETDDDKVVAVLREYFPPEPITRELLRSLDQVAKALVECKHLGLHPLTEYFAVEGCFYTVEASPPATRLSAHLLSTPLTPEAGGRLLGQLTLLILGLSASEPPVYHGALSPSAIAFADAEGPPMLVSPRVLADVVQSANLPSPRDALNRDLRAAALLVLHGVSGADPGELANNPAARRSIIDSKFPKSSDGPVLEWLAGEGPPPESGRVLLDFQDAVVKGCASMAREDFEDAERAWQNALLHYRCPMVEAWAGVARAGKTPVAVQQWTPSVPAPPVGDWRCPYCRCLNFPDSAFCGRCGTKRGEREPKNRPANAAPKPVVLVAAPQPAAPIFAANDWRCQYCQLVNSPDSAFCGKCGTKRGEQKPQNRLAVAPAASAQAPSTIQESHRTENIPVIEGRAAVLSEDAPSDVPQSFWSTELRWIAGILCLFVAIIVFAVVQDQQQRNKQRLQEEIARQEAEDRAAALRKQLEGLWHESGEYDSNYSGGDKARYHAKFTGTLRVSPDGGGFRGVWNETYIFRDSNHPRGYTAYYQATFALEISGDQVTSNPKSARRRYNHGDWKSLAGVTFSGAITQAGLKYHIVWEKSANGTEIDWTSGTLKH